jgi:hypothetical protein
MYQFWHKFVSVNGKDGADPWTRKGRGGFRRVLKIAGIHLMSGVGAAQAVLRSSSSMCWVLSPCNDTYAVYPPSLFIITIKANVMSLILEVLGTNLGQENSHPEIINDFSVSSCKYCLNYFTGTSFQIISGLSFISHPTIRRYTGCPRRKSQYSGRS